MKANIVTYSYNVLHVALTDHCALLEICTLLFCQVGFVPRSPFTN